MFMPSLPDASASTVPPANGSAPASSVPASPTPEPIRHLLFGTLPAVQATIRLLYRLNYAEPNDWSQPISTGCPNEVMAILTKRVRLER
jgi:hypothetical protein